MQSKKKPTRPERATRAAPTTRATRSTTKTRAMPVAPLWQQLGDFSKTAKGKDWPMFNGQPVPLGGISIKKFLKEYWHKKPLLIRQAIPDFQAFFQPQDAIAALQNENVESRLVIDSPTDGWSLQHGPLKKSAVPSRRQERWSTLIQGVDLHHPLGHALINLFRFIPDIRLDDLMISFATNGGGVGPHYDAYDVFLLQGYGKRHWAIAQEPDRSIRPNLPVRILQHFTPEQEWTLEPGDMLYLPPQYAHDGVAVGDCMTYSIGFRTPSFQELGVALLQFIEDNLELKGHYADPDLKYQDTPAKIPKQMIQEVSKQLKAMRWDDDWITESLGCYLSEPKPSVFFDLPASNSLAQFKQQVKKQGLHLAYATKMLYLDPWIFINGEHFVVDGQDATLLKELANQRHLSAQTMAQIGARSELWPVWHDWYEQGWFLPLKT